MKILSILKNFNKGLTSTDLKIRESIPFDPTTHYPVIKSSICNGEKLAGFKNKINGNFTEVMLIKSEDDIIRFKKIYDLDLDKIPNEF